MECHQKQFHQSLSNEFETVLRRQQNVLVRYCGHIPRNYQYKDGVQQVFLILREHLGDENLDLAGGVLYELIEIECEHTHDSGAAFQRWRHDHMTRYFDLELPHVPHMTTITLSVVPTKKLIQWRAEHPDRYPFVLSDSKPPEERISVEHSCIRNRKPWLIENTFYVSSQTTGTLPLSSPNPREFHEMQWQPQNRSVGRLVHEKEISIANSDHCSVCTPPGMATTKSSMGKPFRISRSSLINKLADKIYRDKKEPVSEQHRRS
ncbi:hypothetical protein BKA67DRAFT_169705 [Truncatella angustata]|uniref:Uncharacterized protein n=1 Tax=Truncatella angustata TaxID=152316 RepID=A0A9P9A018_9PEZI|nr:uncharacterized protein BKA67DRAFT_169705 [Truncatella angustata]KAH6656808.1 hypothetical protein BKA67DRAFT_169705 [Truncatella angustata]